jgi:DNA gyrase subunit A
MNMVALVDNQPRLLNLKQMLEYFLQHRREVVTRRTIFELRKARERGHVLEGLAVALANIDEFIRRIRQDIPFAEKWGLKIEKRELSRDERIDLYAKEYTPGIRNKYEKPFDDFIDAKLETRNIPTKLITITYNDKTIESYE